MKQFGFIFIILSLAFVVKAQPLNCVFMPPQFTLNFGSGDIADINTARLYSYERVSYSCPGDGYYSFASYTSDCFDDDWHTLSDHTPGDVDGNMLLVNAAPEGGVFLSIPVTGLKSNTEYELALWLINLCRPSRKCPDILLPSISIELQTPEGNTIVKFRTGDLPRVPDPVWMPNRAMFRTPVLTSSTLQLVMADNAPGGCGNDFALDDITIRECVKQKIQLTEEPVKPVKQPTAAKPPPKKTTPPRQTNLEQPRVIKPKIDTASKTITVGKQPLKIFPPPPLILKTRENTLVKQIETNAGAIKIEIYDNGEIDGDTVSIYHNNTLIRSHTGLSQKPISITINIDTSQPHHELVMVAENLGSIPPNTSVMIITTESNRYEVLISSNEQKNAKVVFDLKK